MNQSNFIQEEVKRAPTLVRRVSDMFKEGTYSGPPSLFSEKIRQSCQNLNQLPYLLYSFENSKTHPIAKKVNMCFDLFTKNFVERFLFVYSSLRRAALTNLQRRSFLPTKTAVKEPVKEQKTTVVKCGYKTKIFKSQKQKPKQIPALLIVAIYLAPIILAFQLVGLCSLLVFGKYTPGFIFLFTSLLVLGFISFKVMFFQAVNIQRKRQESSNKRKQE